LAFGVLKRRFVNVFGQKNYLVLSTTLYIVHQFPKDSNGAWGFCPLFLTSPRMLMNCPKSPCSVPGRGNNLSSLTVLVTTSNLVMHDFTGISHL
jgi:hypothetical protein